MPGKSAHDAKLQKARAFDQKPPRLFRKPMQMGNAGFPRLMFRIAVLQPALQSQADMDERLAAS